MYSITFATYAAVLLIPCIIISSSCGVTQDILATICSLTQNQEICENILNTDPRTPSADLPLLSLISIELTTKQADKNYNTFLKFRDNSTYPALRNSYDNCTRFYQDMQDKLNVAYQLSQKRQYKNINGLGQLTTLAYNCENGLPSNSPTAGITETMLLTSQTAIFVNQFVSDHSV